jgi:HEAT repeat protein
MSRIPKRQLGLVLPVLVLLVAIVWIWVANQEEEQKYVEGPLSGDLESERQVLLKGEGNPETLGRALLRVAAEKHVDAREFAFKNYESPDLALRMSVAKSLGYFPDRNSRHVLGEMLIEPSEAVRVSALEGIGELPEKLCTDLLKKASETKRTGREKVWMELSSYHCADSEVSKEAALERLLDFSKQKGFDGRTFALSEVFRISPDHPKVSEAAKIELRSQSDPSLVANIIDTFGRKKDEWLKAEIPRLVNSPTPQVRAAAVRNLFPLCPDNRWEMISQIAQVESEETVLLSVVDTIETLGSKRALGFLLDMSRSTLGNYPRAVVDRATSAKNLVQDGLKKLNSAKQAMDRCEMTAS